MDGQGDEKDTDLPKQSVVRAAKNSRARDYMLSAELQQALVAASTEFVHLVTSEANDSCEKAGKKLLTPELVIGACEKLGFGHYAEQLRELAGQADETARAAREKKKSSQNVCTPEERARLQQLLFAEAAQQMKGTSVVPGGGSDGGNNNPK